jgi:hypothetical protein
MCPTCGVTIQKVNDGIPRVWWCPRCGTIKSEGGVPEHEAPSFIRSALMALARYNPPRSDPGPFSGPLWAKVGQVFGLGNVQATRLCIEAGFDPNQQAD